ncbi:delta(1)-pyrroline-2-carboxylate reductase family protein [Acetobacter sacchari]|uniref:Delta(1)-pyrroline-2-carboxylate reductase family protein n=1 Tax=Acetobacter sacchari TaxID=2661687 RepID=A0ABS3LUP8_9PROT|nr:delta(1)-pyrroline-2-carboxylate reductase family protein [Acetobacter sacchari]
MPFRTRNTNTVDILDAAQTAALLPWTPLIETLEATMLDYAAGKILCPERQTLMPPGREGVMLSMPSAAADVFCHKLVTVYPGNAAHNLPAIHGVVTCGDARDGRTILSLDGPTVTARRTAAVTFVAIRRLLPAPPRSVLLIGTGVQAQAHVEGLFTLWPDIRVTAQGRSVERERALRAATDSRVALSHEAVERGQQDATHDAVVIATTAREPVYDLPGRAGALVVGLGAFRPDMAEIGPATLESSALYVDDPHGAPSEAGDLIQAGIDWNRVRPLASALAAPPDSRVPVVCKTVGCAAWDLAACRTALGFSGAQ